MANRQQQQQQQQPKNDKNGELESQEERDGKSWISEEQLKEFLKYLPKICSSQKKNPSKHWNEIVAVEVSDI